MNLTRVIAKNSLFQLLSRFVSAFVVLLVTILITRNLPREVWGNFVIITSYVGLFTLIADFGINAIFVRQVTKAPEESNKLFQNLLGLRVMLSIFAIFSALAILAFLPHSGGVKVGIILAVSLILFQNLQTSASAVFQYKLRYDLYAIADIIGSVVLLALVFLSVTTNTSLSLIVLIFVISAIVKAALSLLFSQRLISSYGIAFDLEIYKVLLLASLPIGIMLILSQVNANIDKQVIAVSSPSSYGVSAAVAVGIYGLSYRIFDFIISLSTYISNSAYPILLNKAKENMVEFTNLSKRLLILLFGIGVAIAIAGWILSPVVLSFFGKYSESITSLRILFTSVPLFFASSLLLWLTIVLNKEKFLPFIYGFAAVVNLSLNLYLVPKYGYNSAAWVTLLSELIIMLLLLLVLYYESFTTTKNSAK